MDKRTFLSKMRQARRHIQKAQELESELISRLSQELGSELEAFDSKGRFDFDNADNLAEAIQCHVAYGETDLEVIWQAYRTELKNNGL